MAESVRVLVPATSANLGPGYDSFGLALNLFDEVEVEAAPDGLRVEVVGEGAAQVRHDERNLVVKTMLTALDRSGSRPPGLIVRCTNRIPHGRGLGSSAAAIVAGVVAAQVLGFQSGPSPDRSGALNLATQLEGHSDNVAAALFGGFTISWQRQADDSYDVGCVSLTPHNDVVPVAMIPEIELKTVTARKVIPSSIDHHAAAANSARAALLVHALTVDPSYLLEATEDRLHQQFRREVMPETLSVVDSLRADGVAAVVSGAGPTVLALVERGQEQATAERAPVGWTAEVLAAETRGVHIAS